MKSLILTIVACLSLQIGFGQSCSCNQTITLTQTPYPAFGSLGQHTGWTSGFTTTPGCFTWVQYTGYIIYPDGTRSTGNIGGTGGSVSYLRPGSYQIYMKTNAYNNPLQYCEKTESWTVTEPAPSFTWSVTSQNQSQATCGSIAATVQANSQVDWYLKLYDSANRLVNSFYQTHWDVDPVHGWRIEHALPYSKSHTFTNLPIGSYTLKLEYDECAGWREYGVRDYCSTHNTIIPYASQPVTIGGSSLGPCGTEVNLQDPNPLLVTSAGGLAWNPTQLNALPIRRGTVTDGTSKLLLVTQSTRALTFTLAGAAATSGTLTKLDGSAATSIGPIAPVNPQTGAGTVVAVFTPPDGYGNASSVLGRDVTVTVSDPTNAVPPRTVTIRLMPPPLVLVHGMWSSPGVWRAGGFVSFLQRSGYTVRDNQLADYSNASTATFDPQLPGAGVNAVYEAVTRGIENYRRQGIAAAQADVVAHSLGGLMTRSFSQQPYFKNDITFKKGYVHRLITLGTPHFGSPLGPLLANTRSAIVLLRGYDIALDWLLEKGGLSVGQCHTDFGASSTALQNINALNRPNAIPTHAISASYLPSTVPLGQSAMLATLFNTSVATIFSNSPNDLIVAVSSQQGGLTNAALTVPFASTVHSDPFAPLTETNSLVVQQEVLRLLSLPGNTSFVANRAQPTAVQTTAPVPAASFPSSAPDESYRGLGSTGGSIQLTAPTRGATYLLAPGTTVNLAFTASSGLVITRAFFLVEGVGVVAAPQHGPFTATLTLPTQSPIGRLNVVAFARDTLGNVYADTSRIAVQPSASLRPLQVSPDTVLLDSLVRHRPLWVRSSFFNGTDTIQVNMTKGSTGTRYTAASPSIIQITPDGVVSALAPGTTSVLVQNGTQNVSVPVKVRPTFATARFRSNAITFPAVPDLGVNAVKALVATCTAGEPVTFTVVSGPATITGTVLTVTGVGPVVVKASQTGNSYFSPAADVVRSFNVGVATAKVTARNLLFGAYPNPVHSRLTVELPLGESGHRVVLFDMQGRAVLSTTFSNKARLAEVEVSHLPSGVYMLEVQTAQGVLHRRIVKE